MKEYIYEVILEDGRSYYHYRMEDAYRVYLEEGVRMYAETKDLFPTKALLYSKASTLLFFIAMCFYLCNNKDTERGEVNENKRANKKRASRQLESARIRRDDRHDLSFISNKGSCQIIGLANK